MSERASRAWLTSYRAALVIPVTAAPIPDGAVLVEGDKIVWVGPRAQQPAAPNARIVELGDSVLAPGLVNAHTHLDLTVMRGLLDGLSFFEWIRAVVAARGVLSADEWLDSARLGVIEALEAGITCVGDTAPTSASFDAMLELGLRGIAYQEVFGPDPAQSKGALADLSGRVATLRSRESSRVHIGVSPHAPYSVSDELYVNAVAWARQQNLPLATHVAESADESDLIARGAGPFADMLRGRGIKVEPRGRSPIGLLDRLGVLGQDALLIHCVRCDDDDIVAIRAKLAPVVTCPFSNRYFGHGDAPWERLLKGLGAIAVGTDSMASNTGLDLLAEVRLALGHPADSTGVSVWMFGTLGGANALRLSDEVGSLTPGKQADLCAFPIPAGSRDTAHLRVGPKASLTVVSGVERVREGRVLGDAEGIRKRVTAASARLRQWRTGATAG
jgi:cytosine/adenosine deaminase-related metal-dependent hydrolase